MFDIVGAYVLKHGSLPVTSLWHDFRSIGYNVRIPHWVTCKIDVYPNRMSDTARNRVRIGSEFALFDISLRGS